MTSGRDEALSRRNQVVQLIGYGINQVFKVIIFF